MPLESEVIVGKLKEEGISETLATGLNFETDDELVAWVGEFKNAMPQVKSIEQYTKEEIEELAKDPAFKGAKGLQGFIDSVRAKANQKTIEPLKPKPVVAELPEELKSQLEDLATIKAELAAEKFTKTVSSKAKAAGLDEKSIAKVLKMVKVGDDDAKIDAEISEMKDFLNEMGVKAMGTSGGGGLNGTKATATLKKIAEKNKK